MAAGAARADRDARTRQLDELPPDPPGQIQGLQDYDFMDPNARQKFQELLDSCTSR